MTNFYQNKTYWLALIMLFFVNFAYAQPCDNGTNQYPGLAVSGPATNGASITVDPCNYAGEYALITGIIANETYTFESAGDYFTIRNANSNAILASGSSPLSVVPINTNDIEMHINLDDNACGTDATCHAVTLTRGTPVCTSPDGTAVYDCATNSIIMTVTDIGSPTTGATSFSASIPDSGLPAQTITAVGDYTFGPVTNTRTWDVLFTDGITTTCDVGVFRLYPACRTIATGCNELIADGGIEAGTAGGWAESAEDSGGTATGFTPINTQLPLDGLQSAWLGGYGNATTLGTPPFTSRVSQSITIPTGSTANLYFWGLWGLCDSSSDIFSITMDGTTVFTDNAGSANCNILQWFEYNVDLTTYADGLAHTLEFKMVEQGLDPNADGTSHSNYFLDEIILEECSSNCDFPIGAAGYDCNTGNVNVTITDAGTGDPYTLSLVGSTAPTQAVTGVGTYTFTGITAGQPYSVVVSDGIECTTTLWADTPTCPCVLPTGTAAYNCTTGNIDVSIANAGGGLAPYVMSLTGSTEPSQTITGTGNYTFANAITGTTYSLVVDNGQGCTATLWTDTPAPCPCQPPVGTATYDCSGDFIALNITNPGNPTGSYNASIDGGTPVNINSVGSYPPASFTGLSQTETYNMVFSDGGGCTASIDYIYGGCRTPGPQCTDVITNGGFENGSPGWTQTALGVLGGGTTNVYEGTDPHINTQFALEGTQAALLGRYGGSDPPVAGTTGPYTSTLSKSILPTNGYTATIHFWGYWETCNNTSDRLEIVVDGNVEATFNAAGAFCGDDKWHEYSVDISAYADGTTAAIDIRLVETGNGPSRFHIDDIMVENCPPDISCPAAYGGLAGVAPDMSDYETDGNIASLQTIAAGTTVDYDAGTQIDMVQGFTVELGATFCAFIDGCNGTGGAVNPLIGGGENNLQVIEGDAPLNVELKKIPVYTIKSKYTHHTTFETQIVKMNEDVLESGSEDELSGRKQISKFYHNKIQASWDKPKR